MPRQEPPSSCRNGAQPAPPPSAGSAQAYAHEAAGEEAAGEEAAEAEEAE